MEPYSYSMMYPKIGLGVMAVFMLILGLRGLLTKRPFLISARWMFIAFMVVFLPPAVSNILSPHPFRSSYQLLEWLPVLMILVVSVLLWIQMKGYLAFGVTEKSFRDGLLAALEKLQLPFEESLSSIHLTSIGVHLQVAVQSWVGSGQIKVKKGRHSPLLKKIVQAMNGHFRTSRVETNIIACGSFVIVGILALAMVVALMVLRDLFEFEASP